MFEHQFKLQDYFLPNSMTIKQSNLLFSLSSRMVTVRCNYRHSYTSLTCQVCEDPANLLKDKTLLAKNKISYGDLFSNKVFWISTQKKEKSWEDKMLLEWPNRFTISAIFEWIKLFLLWFIIDPNRIANKYLQRNWHPLEG